MPERFAADAAMRRRSADGGPPGNGPNSGREPALFPAWAAGPVSHNPINIPLN